MINSIKTLFTKLYYTFVLSSYEQRAHEYFNKKNMKKINSKVVLVQTVEDVFYYGLFGTIVSNLRQNNSVIVEQIVIRNLTVNASKNVSGFLKSIFINNRIRDNKWVKLYSSYCDKVAYRYEGSTNILFDIKAIIMAYKILKNIKNRNDLIQLKIDNIKVGDLINDSYLRYKPSAGVSLNDFYLCIIIWQCIRNIYLTKKYFEKNVPDIFLTSYSTYIHHGVSVRVAVEYKTKVYSFGNYQKFAKLLTKDDYYHTQSFSEYNQNFDLKQDKEAFLKTSIGELDDKLKGNLHITTSYMKESAYKITNTDVPNLTNAIIVFMHDFFDSPHIYGNMIFHDFLEWIVYTIKICKSNNINYYLKPHPNQTKESLQVLNELMLNDKSIKIISSKITNKQLVEAGIKGGVSVYGTVAHELAYMGIPVILASENPHSSYSFCFEAKTKDEYENFIINYSFLKLPSDYKRQVASFNYMHNLSNSTLELDLLIIINKFRKLEVLDDETKLNEFFCYLSELNKNIAFKEFINKRLI